MPIGTRYRLLRVPTPVQCSSHFRSPCFKTIQWPTLRRSFWLCCWLCSAALMTMLGSGQRALPRATVMATAFLPWPCGFAACTLWPWICGCCCLGLRASQLQPTELVVDPATVVVMRRGDARCVITAAFATGSLFASLVFVGLRVCSTPRCRRHVQVEVVSRKNGPALTEYVGYTSNDSCTHAYSNCCGMRTFTQVRLCSKCFTLK